MALVKGKIDTSGPILRRAGFAAYGQEPIYDVPLVSPAALLLLLSAEPRDSVLLLPDWAGLVLISGCDGTPSRRLRAD